jgi:GTP-binding protein EngB required for normal cell division
MLRRSCFHFVGVTSSRPINTQPTPPNPRDLAVEQLALDVFGKGNKLLKVVDDLGTLPEGLHSFPEVCFVGKPACGKSSVIASLCHNRHMGRTGRAGGRTTKLEFFNVGDCMLLVDTPSYGAWQQRDSAQNALGVTLLRRYISLRKTGNLKQVYWLIECPRYENKLRYRNHVNTRSREVARDSLRIEPRDEEMLDFLAHEKVPFTVLLSKADSLRDSPERIQRAMNDVYEFVGTDEIPVMPVACRPQRPDLCRNLHELMCDVTDKCCQELADNEITMKGLHSLSYLPPTAESIITVETQYPVESHVMPISDSQSIGKLVELHNEAKMGFVRVRQASKLFSTAQFETALSHSHEELVGSAAHAQIASGKADESQLLEGRSSATSTTAAAPLDSTLVTQSANTAGSLNVVTTTSQKQQQQQQQHAVTNIADLLPNNRASATTISNVLGVAIPVTMVGPGTTAAARKIDQSADAYAAMVEAHGYYGIVNSAEDFFITEDGTPSHQEMTLRERLRGPRYISHREISTRRMLEKYVGRVRKERSIQLDAHGYMCPWLGTNSGGGQRVKGSGVVTSGGSGALVRGLKEVGFGGQGFSRKTMKGTFRATSKTGFWAT